MTLGRPTTYNPLVHVPLCQDLMAKGYWNYEVAAVFDITYKTFNSWTHEYEEFKEAVEKGECKRAAFWTELGRNAVLNKEKDFQFKPWIANMNNQMQKFGWGIGEEGRKTAATQININNMNVLQGKDTSELLEMFQNKIASLDPKLLDLLPVQVKELDESNKNSD